MATENIELEGKKTFEGYVSSYLHENRKDVAFIKNNPLYYGLMANLDAAAESIRHYSEKDGKYKEDSPEFKETQRNWWVCYRQIAKLRDITLRYYEIPNPDWQNEIVPERLYVGRVCSQEDFVKYMQVPPKESGLALIEPKTMDDIIHDEMAAERHPESDSEDEEVN